MIIVLICLTFCKSELTKPPRFPNPDLLEERLNQIYPETFAEEGFECIANGLGIDIEFQYDPRYTYTLRTKRYYSCSLHKMENKTFMFYLTLLSNFKEPMKSIITESRYNQCVFYWDGIRENENYYKYTLIEKNKSLYRAFQNRLKKTTACDAMLQTTLDLTAHKNGLVNEYEKESEKINSSNEVQYSFDLYRRMFCRLIDRNVSKIKEEYLFRKIDDGKNGPYIHWTEYLCNGCRSPKCNPQYYLEE